MSRWTLALALSTVAATSPVVAAPDQAHGPHTTTYTFRFADAVTLEWIVGALVTLTPRDGSPPPPADVTDRGGAATFAVTSPAGTVIDLELTAPGYCPTVITTVLPKKHGRGLAPQFTVEPCRPGV